MRFDVITLFPEMFDAITKHGITSRALQQKIYDLQLWNPRDFTSDNHKTVDDRPYGGGPGMVMLAEPLEKAIKAVKDSQTAELAQVDADKKIEEINDKENWVIHFSPAGKPLTHQKVMQLSKKKNLVLLTSRYEGVDQRLIDAQVDEELSIGDYVLSGGELPAMALIDAIVRQLPGSLGDGNSAIEDSFVDGLLDCPHYTRPEEYNSWRIPDVLKSGHEAKINEWRYEESVKRTQERRPDMLKE